MHNYREAREFNGLSLSNITFPMPAHSLATHFIALLLEKEPNNLQAQSLAQLIEKADTHGALVLLYHSVLPAEHT